MPNLKNGKRYQITNWRDYNKALVQRGSITIWIEDGALESWLSSSGTGKAGRPEVYSEAAILTLLMVRQVFHLPLRALQGFVTSIFALMHLPLPVPCYTQVSRRARTLKRQLKRLTRKKIRDLVFDSSGLKVYGEGEWKVRIHGKSKRRTWRKLHIGLDGATQEIVVQDLTENSAGDASTAAKLLKRFKQIDRVYGDGSYDGSTFRKGVYELGGECVVPPPRNARYKGIRAGPQRDRDAALAEILGLGGDSGRKLWKKLKGYHLRSLSETCFYRIKTLFGGNLKARSWEGQRSESYVTCLALNRMTRLGMPQGEWVIAT